MECDDTLQAMGVLSSDPGQAAQLLRLGRLKKFTPRFLFNVI